MKNKNTTTVIANPVPAKLCLVCKIPHRQNPQGLSTLKSQQNLEGLTKSCNAVARKYDAVARNNDAVARNNDTVARNNDTVARNNDTVARKSVAFPRKSFASCSSFYKNSLLQQVLLQKLCILQFFLQKLFIYQMQSFYPDAKLLSRCKAFIHMQLIT
jgi:hypothetical protein